MSISVLREGRWRQSGKGEVSEGCRLPMRKKLEAAMRLKAGGRNRRVIGRTARLELDELFERRRKEPQPDEASEVGQDKLQEAVKKLPGAKMKKRELKKAKSVERGEWERDHQDVESVRFEEWMSI
eukprot:6189415-Pleurochrysis_carterae.AAC.1